MIHQCFVETRDGEIIRIFKNRSSAIASEAWGEDRVEAVIRSDAVLAIRTAVFDLAGGECKYCGKYVSFDGGHMHEEVHRGEGGEMSIDNSVWACSKCHENQHPEKRVRFGEHGL